MLLEHDVILIDFGGLSFDFEAELALGDAQIAFAVLYEKEEGEGDKSREREEEPTAEVEWGEYGKLNLQDFIVVGAVAESVANV